MARVVILGAGLTGLSAALHLDQTGFFDYEIFEKEAVPGGLLRSIRQDGFIFDHSGHILHINNPYFMQFSKDIWNHTELLAHQRKTFVLSHGVCTQYPYQENLQGLPQRVIKECLIGFINRPKSNTTPKTFHDWATKHFGYGIAKHFLLPHNEKILQQDMHDITPSWTGRFIPQTNLKTLLKGAILPDQTSKSGYNSSFFYPKAGGIHHLTDKIAQKIHNPISSSHEAVMIDPKQKIVLFNNGKICKYEHLISTMPLPHLIKILKHDSASTLKTAKDQLIASSVLNFNIGLKVNTTMPAHWIYVPEKQYSFYRFGFWHNFSPAMAPKGCSSIYGDLAFNPAKTTKTNLNELALHARNKVLQLLHLNEEHIVTQKNLVIKNAYVIYNAWRERNLTDIHSSLHKNAIYSVGRFGEWKYSSMQEAVLDGKTIANQLLSHQLEFNRHLSKQLDEAHPKKQCNA